MHEVRATIPPEAVPEAARLAHDVGIKRVDITDVFVHGPGTSCKQISFDTSTPQAKAFIDRFLKSPTLSAAQYTLTSREVRAILDGDPPDQLTHPLAEPFPDVIQDFWQLSHITPTYVCRAGAGAALLATGIIEDNPASLVLHGVRALSVSLALALIAGAVVAAIEGGPIRFRNFRPPLASFAVSAMIGITAGLSAADDTGRRYLIGVAAAVQLAVFPVWFGAALVLGLPPSDQLRQRLASFLINLVTIAGTAVIACAALHFRAGGGWTAPRSSR